MSYAIYIWFDSLPEEIRFFYAGAIIVLGLTVLVFMCVPSLPNQNKFSLKGKNKMSNDDIAKWKNYLQIHPEARTIYRAYVEYLIDNERNSVEELSSGEGLHRFKGAMRVLKELHSLVISSHADFLRKRIDGHER